MCNEGKVILVEEDMLCRTDRAILGQWLSQSPPKFLSNAS